MFDPDKSLKESAEKRGGGKAQFKSDKLNLPRKNPNVIDQRDISSEDYNSVPDDNSLGME